MTSSNIEEDKIDSQELDPKLRKAFDSARTEAKARLEKTGARDRIGSYCEYWQILKSVLKDKYEIDWQSPAELHPLTSFD